MKVAVGYSQHAGLSAGASFIHLEKDVGRTADVDVGVGTSSVFHASIASRLHHNDWAETARRVERLPLTVLHHHFYIVTVTTTTRQLSYRKEDRAMRPIYGCTEKFW